MFARLRNYEPIATYPTLALPLDIVRHILNFLPCIGQALLVSRTWCIACLTHDDMCIWRSYIPCCTLGGNGFINMVIAESNGKIWQHLLQKSGKKERAWLIAQCMALRNTTLQVAAIQHEERCIQEKIDKNTYCGHRVSKYMRDTTGLSLIHI